MKKLYYLLLCAELFMAVSVCAAVPEIKLTARKGHVLAIPVRDSVLTAAEVYLKPADSGFMAQAASIQSPYGEEPKEVAAESEVKTSEPVEALVHYGDDSVLKVIGATFARQVRGTLEKGGRSYLQLQGGGLLKSGTSFPAKIPEIKDQTFTVTVSDISSRGYTLSMGESTLPVFFNASSGATKDRSE